jgi:hypothetical protein
MRRLKRALGVVAEVAQVMTAVASDVIESWGTGISRQELVNQNQLLKTRVFVMQQEIDCLEDELAELRADRWESTAALLSRPYVGNPPPPGLRRNAHGGYDRCDCPECLGMTDGNQ